MESIFYKKKEVEIDKLKHNKIVLLTPILNLLDEVEIDPKKYTVLNAYYRIFDSIPYNEYKLKGKNPYWVSDLKKTSLFEKLNSKFNLIKGEEEGSI